MVLWGPMTGCQRQSQEEEELIDYINETYAPGAKRGGTQPLDRNKLAEILPRGSKYPIFEASGSKNQVCNGILEPDTSNIGYLDPWGDQIPSCAAQKPYHTSGS